MARVTQEHVDARRRQIMEAAARQFAMKGTEPGAATIDDVAAAAGLSKGSIYSYFKNKDELLAAIIEEGLEGDIAAFARSREQTRSSWDAFWAISRQVWDSLLDPSSKEKMMLSLDRLLAEVRAGRADRRAVDVPITALTELLEGAQREGKIAPDFDPRVLATALWNVQQGTRDYVLRTGDTQMAEAVYSLLRDLLLRTAPGSLPKDGPQTPRKTKPRA